MATTLQIQTICDLLIDSNTTASSFVLTLLTQREYNANPCTQDLLHNSRSLLSAFLEHPQSSNDVWKWASSIVKQKYGQSIRDLAEKDTGWHFGAMHASESWDVAGCWGLERSAMVSSEDNAEENTRQNVVMRR